MRVTNYTNEETIEFCCDECGFVGELGVTQLLSDNCVFDLDVMCDTCGDSLVVYVLKCKDPARAKELHARLGFLKTKRAAEDEINGYKSNNKGRSG